MVEVSKAAQERVLAYMSEKLGYSRNSYVMPHFRVNEVVQCFGLYVQDISEAIAKVKADFEDGAVLSDILNSLDLHLLCADDPDPLAEAVRRALPRSQYEAEDDIIRNVKDYLETTGYELVKKSP